MSAGIKSRLLHQHFIAMELLRNVYTQFPIGSGFGAASTAADVIKGIDLTGKTSIVTGGYSGIGTETIRALRSAGAKLTVPARDLRNAKAALADMPDVAIETMDLLDPASIDSFANRFLAKNPALQFSSTTQVSWRYLSHATHAGTNHSSLRITSDTFS